MSQNGQTRFKNLAAFAAIFLKCVWPFWDICIKELKSGFIDWMLNFIILKIVKNNENLV